MFADKYIRNHGLSFNPTKTECMISGHNPFTNEPSWMIDNQSVTVVPSIKYLGTILDNSPGSSHKLQDCLQHRERYTPYRGLD